MLPSGAVNEVLILPETSTKKMAFLTEIGPNVHDCCGVLCRILSAAALSEEKSNASSIEALLLFVSNSIAAMPGSTVSLSLLKLKAFRMPAPSEQFIP